MDLPRRGRDKILRADLLEEAAAILLYPVPAIGRRKPQAQPGAGRLAHAALPRAEGVHKPR
jgi:hypothetical protein